MEEALIRLLMVVAVAVGSGVTSNPRVEAVRLSPERLSASATASTRSWHGNAGWAVPSLGADYLAIRAKRGTVVRIEGPGGVWVTASTDYGPSSKIRPARVADIAAGHWRAVCGLPLSAGLCAVSISVVGGIDEPVTATAPPTDVEGGN